MKPRESMIETSQPVRIGVIGAGMRMRGVLGRVLKSAPSHRLQVQAVYDPDENACAALRDLAGYDIKTYSSAEDLVASDEIDWVFIGSWNNFHARQSIMAMEAGKHVFCEKPLATTFDDCLAMQKAAAASGCIFALGLVLRYSPHYSQIRAVIDSGRIGKIVSFEFNETLGSDHGGYIFGDWRRRQEFSGGHMLEKCCHDIDLANWLTGSLPDRVASFGGKNFFTPEFAHRVEEIGPDKAGFPAYGGWKSFAPHLLDPFRSDSDIVDNQVAILEYATGVRATFHTNCNAGIPERRMYFLGSNGSLRADLVTGQLEVIEIGPESKIEIIPQNAPDGHGGGDPVMAEALARTILTGEPPLASIREGISSAVTALGMDISLQEGRIVDLSPFWEKANIH